MHNGRRFTLCQCAIGLGLHLLILFFTGSALAADLKGTRRNGDTGIRHAHNLVCDVICLGFQRVTDGADGEFALQTGHSAGYQAQHGLVAKLSFAPIAIIAREK